MTFIFIEFDENLRINEKSRINFQFSVTVVLFANLYIIFKRKRVGNC